MGVETPQGKITDERMVKQHNKFRLNIDAIADSIVYHNDFHLKPVWDGKDEVALTEIKEFISQLIEKLQERYYGASAWTEAFTKKQLEGWIKEIMESISTCCAITMEPDEVLGLCDKLKNYLEND